MRYLVTYLVTLWLGGTAHAITFKSFITGLADPVCVVAAPGEANRLYICEQEGRIIQIENGKKVAAPFLDIEDKVESGGELGLLGLAFHPDYARNGRYFVNYTTRDPGLMTVIAEFDKAGKEKRLLTFPQPFTNHNGGQLAFGPDGYLYIGTGDGGSAGDPQGNGQKLNTFLGKLLRLDVDSASPYAVPKDNPFAKGEGKPEIFAYGLRNPWRFSFDRLTKALFVADVGQNTLEEIDIVEKGKNYGWNTMEGTFCFKPSVACDKKGLELPIYEYPRTVGQSITGGYVYRGTAIPELAGVYLYADYQSNKVFGLNYDQAARRVVENKPLATIAAVSAFGEDAAGEIYVQSYQGTLYKVSP